MKIKILLIAFTVFFIQDAFGQNPKLLKDIRPGAASSSPSDFIKAAGNYFLFSATDSAGNGSLWSTDGIKTFTELHSFKGGGAGQITEVANRHAVFIGTETASGSELWTTDGSVTGTYLLKDITPGAMGSDFSFGSVINGKLFFIARTDSDRNSPLSSLWVSDGTVDGTLQLQENINYVYPVAGEPLNDLYIFYSFVPFKNNYELWRSDGTVAGTFKLATLGYTSPNQGWLAASRTHMYFHGYDAEHGDELWRTDGSVAGTKLVKDINPGSASSNPQYFTAYQRKIYFTATTAESGTELWVTSPKSGTYQVADIYKGSGSGANSISGVAGPYLYFVGIDSLHGSEMWRTDGSSEGTILLKNVNPDNSSSAFGPWTLVAAGDDAYYLEDIPGYYDTYTLCKTDGTPAGTSIVDKNVINEYEDVYPEDLQITYTNGYLYYVDYFDVKGESFEVLRLKRTDGVQSKEFTFSPFEYEGVYNILYTDRDTLYLNINTVANGFELYKLNLDAPIKTMEICNGKDDDLDGVIDNIAYLTPTGTVSNCKGSGNLKVQSNIAYSNFSYQWLNNGKPVQGETTNLLAGREGTPDTGNYEIVVSSKSCVDTTGQTHIIATDPPPATITPLGNLNICKTGFVDLEANAGPGYSYLWLYSGSMRKDIDQIYRATQALPYSVEVTDTWGCLTISANTIVTNSCREESSADESPGSNFSLYPNPASTDLEIHINQVNDDPVTVWMIDLTGRIIQSEKISGEGIRSGFIIHLPSEISNGVYMLKLETENHSYQKLFEVQR